MESTMKLLFGLALLKAISAHRLHKMFSPHCKYNKPTEFAHNCCIIPDLFEIETNQGCSNMERVLEPALRGSPECAERTCLLRNNDLLFENDVIDKLSVTQYLDEWVSRRKEYQPAINSVKERCLGEKPMFGPVEMCEADKLLFCINSNFYNKCPNWIDNEGCRALRAYMETCLPYYD